MPEPVNHGPDLAAWLKTLERRVWDLERRIPPQPTPAKAGIRTSAIWLDKDFTLPNGLTNVDLSTFDVDDQFGTGITIGPTLTVVEDSLVGWTISVQFDLALGGGDLRTADFFDTDTSMFDGDTRSSSAAGEGLHLGGTYVAPAGDSFRLQLTHNMGATRDVTVNLGFTATPTRIG